MEKYLLSIKNDMYMVKKISFYFWTMCSTSNLVIAKITDINGILPYPMMYIVTPLMAVQCVLIWIFGSNKHVKIFLEYMIPV